jgi:hypothetical protein
LVLKNNLAVYYFSKIAPEDAYHDHKWPARSQFLNHLTVDTAHGVAHLMSCWTNGAKGSRRMNCIMT